MTDRFLPLSAVIYLLPGKQRSVEHLRKIAQAQAGIFAKPRFSQAALASYPKFTKGLGGEWGCFESQIEKLWLNLRAKAHTNVYEFRSQKVNG